MKRIILSFFALMTISLVKGQNEDVTFKVTNFEINGENYDNLALEGDVALSFYMCDKETLCFANHWRNSNSQSYGGIFGLKKREIAETETSYGAEEFKFTWKFYNTYDNINGEAVVTFTKIYIGNNVKFRAEMLVLNTNEILIFKGYME